MAIKIVKGLDAARRVSSLENPVDEVGLIEAGIEDALSEAYAQIAVRDEEIACLKSVYEPPSRRSRLDAQSERARELAAKGFSYREIAARLNLKSISSIRKIIHRGDSA
jgi:DNA-binding NarL/FixJ family response regulator